MGLELFADCCWLADLYRTEACLARKEVFQIATVGYDTTVKDDKEQLVYMISTREELLGNIRL